MCVCVCVCGCIYICVCGFQALSKACLIATPGSLLLADDWWVSKSIYHNSKCVFLYICAFPPKIDNVACTRCQVPFVLLPCVVISHVSFMCFNIFGSSLLIFPSLISALSSCVASLLVRLCSLLAHRTSPPNILKNAISSQGFGNSVYVSAVSAVKSTWLWLKTLTPQWSKL